MEYVFYPFDALDGYFGVDVMALYRGRWIFCRHMEAGETSLEAARRELYEETGAIDFTLEPLCDYFVEGERTGRFF